MVITWHTNGVFRVNSKIIDHDIKNIHNEQHFSANHDDSEPTIINGSNEVHELFIFDKLTKID